MAKPVIIQTTTTAIPHEYIGDWASLIRVSTDEQFKDGDSPDTQRNLNEETSKKHGGKIFKEYIEDGVSAFKKRIHQRPVMMQLLGDIAAGKVKNIVAFKRDRICRDPVDYYLLRDAFSKAGVKVHLTCGTEKWGDPDSNSPTEELLDGLMPLLAKFESMTTSQRVRANVQELVKKGEWRTGRPPYGYTYNKETKRVEQVPEQVQVVKLIKDLYVQGHGAGKIAHLLNNEYKIPYQSSAADWTKGNKTKRDYWYEGVVTAIVSKPVYMGVQVWGGEWYECPAIDAIFAKDEWEEVYTIYQSKLSKKIPHKYYNSVFIYKDVLFCAYCGEKLIPTYKTQKYQKQNGEISIYENYHYKCSGRWDKMNGCKCKKHNREYLENAIGNIISDRIKGFDIHSLYKKLITQVNREIKDYNAQLLLLQNELKDLERDADQYLDAYLKATTGSSIRKGLELKYEQIQASILDYNEKIENHLLNPPKQDIAKTDVACVYEGMSKWEGIMNNPQNGREVKRKLALEVVKRIEVDNDGNIDIQFNIGSDFPIKESNDLELLPNSIENKISLVG